jgi:secreted PhoX family phosphatase
MDRPEDVQTNPVNGRVYVMLTNNTRRKPEQVDAVNPRASNAHGQVVELVPPGGAGADADHTADEFGWNMFLMGGNPEAADVGAKYHAQTQAWLSSPDNCAFDSQGRLWISTDGNNAKVTGRADGLWAVETEGELRGTSRHFFRVPVGAELCGPVFTPSDETLFLAVQHPGEPEDGVPASFENPITGWPDFKPGMPPRPSVLAITRRGGGKIA